MHKIKLKDREISFSLRRSKRARRMRLAVYCGGSLVVTAPENFSFSKVENFILEKTEWVLEKIGIMSKRNRTQTLSWHNKKEYERIKNQALAFVEAKLKKLNLFYGFNYNRITIRNQKTRWGSCSKNRSLNFNYKIALLPDDLADYIIVHELCHLGEFNHSKRFWKLVARTIPDYKEKRLKIKNI